MISTPLRMENPVRRPIVPPIKPNWASIVTFESFPIEQCVDISKKNVKKGLHHHLFILFNLIIGCCVKVDVHHFQWGVLQCDG